MKTELQDKLVEVIGAIQTGVAKTTDFAVTQLPDVAQQYVVYGRVIETLSLFVMLMIVALGAWLLWISFKKFKEDGDFIVAVLASGFATGTAMFFSCIVATSTALVWFAPKIYLIKGLAGLLK